MISICYHTCLAALVKCSTDRPYKHSIFQPRKVWRQMPRLIKWLWNHIRKKKNDGRDYHSLDVPQMVWVLKAWLVISFANKRRRTFQEAGPSGRRLGHYRHVLERDPGTQALLFLTLASCHVRCLLHSAFLPQSQEQLGNPPWTKPLKLSQKKAFLFISGTVSP